MLDPARPFANASKSSSPTSKANRELSGTVERAKQERFRLMRMLQDARAQVAATTEQVQSVSAQPAAVERVVQVTPEERAALAGEMPAALPQPAAPVEVASPQAGGVSVTKLQGLVDKLMKVDAQIDAKLERLNALTDTKLERLNRLDAQCSDRAESLGQTLSAAHGVAAQLEPLVVGADAAESRLLAAVESAGNLPAQVTAQLERFDAYIDTYAASGEQRFANHLAEMKQMMLDEMVAEMGQNRIAFDAEIAHRHVEAAAQLSERFDALAASLTDRAGSIADNVQSVAENAAEAAGARVRKQTMAAMVRSHEVQEQFKSQIESHREAHRQHLDKLSQNADDDLLVAAQKVDERMAGLADLFDHQVEQILGELRTRAWALIDQMSSTVLRLQGTPVEGDDDRRAA